MLEKARSDGYNVYIYESKRDDSPFYKVRARGPRTKEEAQALADKLTAGGYPVYLVPVKK